MNDVLPYIGLLLFVVSVAFYVVVFRKSKVDDGLILIAGGKSGLAATIFFWFVLLIDGMAMLVSNEDPSALGIGVAVICGIAIIASVVMAAVKSVGWKNKLFCIYGHLYTVFIAMLVISLIVGLFIVNWISRKKALNLRTGKEEYVDSNDIFAMSARGLMGILLQFIKQADV